MAKRGRPSKKRYCKYCGTELPVATVRRQNYCEECAIERFQRNIAELRSKTGEFYEKWRRGLLKSLERRKNENHQM